MTNPNNAVGVNAAYRTRTSVNAVNDLAQIFGSRGVLSGWAAAPKSGMTVSVGGAAGVRDVAIGEDNLGNRVCLDNRSASEIDVVIPAASVSSARYDAIVVYANNPAQAADTTPDAPSVCGIIVASGNASGVSDAQIRAAITTDGGTGSTAYYAVLAMVYVGAGSTVITSGNISQEWLHIEPEDGSITSAKLADAAVTKGKIDWTSMVSEDVTDEFVLNTSIFDTNDQLPTMLKIGNLVQLAVPYIRIKVATQANVWFSLGTIPQSLVPAAPFELPACELKESDGSVVGTFRVAFTGTNIQVKAQTAVNVSGSFSSAMSFNTSWLIG